MGSYRSARVEVQRCYWQSPVLPGLPISTVQTCDAQYSAVELVQGFPLAMRQICPCTTERVPQA